MRFGIEEETSGFTEPPGGTVLHRDVRVLSSFEPPGGTVLLRAVLSHGIEPWKGSSSEPSYCQTEPTSNPVGNTVASQAVSIIGLVKPLDFDWVAGNSSPAGFPESFVGDEYRYGG